MNPNNVTIYLHNLRRSFPNKGIIFGELVMPIIPFYMSNLVTVLRTDWCHL